MRYRVACRYFASSVTFSVALHPKKPYGLSGTGTPPRTANLHFHFHTASRVLFSVMQRKYEARPMYQGRGPHHGRPTSTSISTQLPEFCSVLCNVSMRQGRCINNDPIPLTVRISVGLHGSCCRRGVVASVHVAGVGIQGVRKEHVTDVLGGQHTRGGSIVPVRHPAGFVGEPGCRRVVLVSHGAHVFISRLEAVQHCTVISRLKAVRHQ